MNQTFIEYIKGNRVVRGILTLVATLFLGALGSGLWELILKDIFLGIGNQTLTLLSSLWSGYLDTLYQNVGKLQSDVLLIPIFSFFVGAGVLGPLYATQYLWRELASLERKASNSDRPDPTNILSIEQSIARVRRKIIRILLPLALVASAIFLVMTWQTLYTREASNWAERSIEIVAPHLKDDEHARLRASLRLISTAKEFSALRLALLSHAKEAGIELPEFKAVGVQGGA